VPRASDQNVKPSSAAHASERAEATEELAPLVRAVSRADDDVVALVALDVLQVLDEQPLERPADAPRARFRQRAGERGIGFRLLVQLVEDQVALCDVETGDADGGRLGAAEQ